MTNTSATGGPIVPAVTPAPLEGNALLDKIQETLVGVSGIISDNVRPRYQADEPNYPDNGVLWMAFGIMSRPGDTFPVIQHDGAAAAGQGADNYQQQEELVVLCSFYDNGSGGQAMGAAAQLRDGIKMPQNMEALGLVQIALGWVGGITPVPSLLKAIWNYRCDLEIHFRRSVQRQYPILNLESAEVDITTSTGFEDDFEITETSKPH